MLTPAINPLWVVTMISNRFGVESQTKKAEHREMSTIEDLFRAQRWSEASAAINKASASDISSYRVCLS